MGVTPSQAIDSVAKKFSSDPESVRRDYTRRKEWARQVTQVDDPAMIYERIASLKEVRNKAWQEYLFYQNIEDVVIKRDVGNMRLGALKLAQSTEIELIKFLQSVGMVEKAPEKIQATMEVSSAFPYLLDPSIKAMTDQFLAKLKAEKEARDSAQKGGT